VASNGSKVLVAGIGNLFLGDDAFGVEVVRRLRAGGLGPGVRLADFGIRGLDLAYALLQKWDLVILVDAATRGRAPGTIYLVQPDAPEAGAGIDVQGHGMVLPKVFAFARSLGRLPERMVLVGCEPSTADEQEFAAGLSDPVRAAIEPAAAMVRDLADRALQGDFRGIPVGVGSDRTERGPW
jgi:hydrogenase maturation protease